MVKYVVKPISQQNKKSCKRNIYKTFLVGVTGFEPALPTAVAWSNRAQSTALLPFLLALGGKTSKKRRTVAFFHRFPLVPNRQKNVFLTLYSHFRRFSLGERCSCALFRPLFPYVPDLFVVKYVVVLHCPCFIQQRIPMISP